MLKGHTWRNSQTTALGGQVTGTIFYQLLIYGKEAQSQRNLGVNLFRHLC